MGRSHDSARDTESNAAKNKTKKAGTEDDGENAPAPKVSAPEPANATDVETTQKKLWELQHKKNAEANTKAYDPNQKTVQALDTLEEEYEIFEETVKKVTHETEEGDMLLELDSAHKDEDGLQDELEFTCEGMVTASRSSPTAGP